MNACFHSRRAALLEAARSCLPEGLAEGIETSTRGRMLADDQPSGNFGVIVLLLAFGILTIIGILAVCILVLVDWYQRCDTESNPVVARRYNNKRRSMMNCNQVEMVRAWEVLGDSGDGSAATRGSTDSRETADSFESPGSAVSLDSQQLEHKTEEDREAARAHILLMREVSKGYSVNPLFQK
ncbi:hypothetical protein CYMTET_42468 [Cymbomonas tetramitiformis]|uniref:Uncharacterized protein n=1 Tax=Cymbomonas tetramitiformis TaxID=36881 RepID=A0AAE0C410_9CHLO|nr:hypothetical protein CYMTET_42468 [Cymbomonas tetramitiformis]